MVFSLPHDETVIINHGRLYMPLHKPLPPPETATILPEIRQHMADGAYQKAADIVVELANKNGYQGKHWTDPFIPACDLKIRTNHQGTIQNYKRSVNFATGVASVAWDDDRGRFTRKLFVSRADDVIVMSIRGPQPGSVDCELTLDTCPDGNSRHFKQGIKDIVRKAAGDLLNYRMVFTNAYEGGIQACEVTAKVITKGGKSDVRETSIVVGGADEVLVLIRVGLPNKPGESTAAALAELPADFDRLLAPHAKPHGESFLRSKLELKGGHGRDLSSEDLISSSTPGATNPALLEKIYDAARGIHVPSRASTHGFNNHFCATWPMTFWTADAPWAAQLMYDYWLYSSDEEFLRQRALPFRKEAAVFYEDFLITGPDGRLLFSPSDSPENEPSNNPSQACINAPMDISAAKELLGNLVAVCEHLKVEPEGVARWRRLLEQVPSYQINAAGALKEWTTPLLEENYAHRHCSHLYAIYNGLPDEIAGDARLREDFRVALHKRLDVRRQEARGISVNGRYAGGMAFGLALEAMAASIAARAASQLARRTH